MSQSTNVAGMIIGKLTVLGTSRSGGKNVGVLWDCLCSCGKAVAVRASKLRAEHTTSCGCGRTKHKKEIAGQRFGKLTVHREVGRTRMGLATWQCECDCGRVITVDGTSLRRGNTTTCGCEQQGLVKDLLGQRFGRLTVLCAEPFQARRRGVSWICRCDCGTQHSVLGHSLRNGTTVSCGCAIGSTVRAPEVRRASAVLGIRYRARMVGADGSFTKEQIDMLYTRQRGKCAEPSCRILLKGKFHRDHVMPLALGGSNAISNIQLMCGRCNNRKHAKHPITWAQQNGRLL